MENKKRPGLRTNFFAKATAATANEYFYSTLNFLQFNC